MRLPPFIQLVSFFHSPHFIHKVNYKTIANCHDLEKKRHMRLMERVSLKGYL
ncbi:hypothetical protein B4133_0722 [Bacillus altitudinis]|nr:hypothetical protein B4133_0722 [Bacillus altitudinis]